MKNNIIGRLFRLETTAPSEEDNREFRERLDRAYARLRAEGYDPDESRDAATLARVDKLLSIFAKSRKLAAPRTWN